DTDTKRKIGRGRVRVGRRSTVKKRKIAALSKPVISRCTCEAYAVRAWHALSPTRTGGEILTPVEDLGRATQRQAGKRLEKADLGSPPLLFQSALNQAIEFGKRIEIGPADVRPQDPAIGVEQDERGEGLHFELRANRTARAAGDELPIGYLVAIASALYAQGLFLEAAADFVGDADDLQSLAGILLMQVPHVRDAAQARCALRPPEVQEDQLALAAGAKFPRLAVSVVEGEVDHLPADADARRYTRRPGRSCRRIRGSRIARREVDYRHWFDVI